MRASIGRLADDIARRQIAADDIIVACGCWPRRSPPPACRARRSGCNGRRRRTGRCCSKSGTGQRPVEAPLRHPMADHLLIGIGAARAGPQILALGRSRRAAGANVRTGRSARAPRHRRARRRPGPRSRPAAAGRARRAPHCARRASPRGARAAPRGAGASLVRGSTTRSGGARFGRGRAGGEQQQHGETHLPSSIRGGHMREAHERVRNAATWPSMSIGRSASPNAPIATSTRHVRESVDQDRWRDALARRPRS